LLTCWLMIERLNSDNNVMALMTELKQIRRRDQIGLIVGIQY